MAKAEAKKDKAAADEVVKLAVIENSKWVDGVLWAQVLIGLAIIGAKALGFDKFKWNDIEITDRSAWLPFALLTIAHLYCTILFIQSMRKAYDRLDDSSKEAVFETITATGGIFVRGLKARVPVKISVPAVMDPTDLSATAAIIALPSIVLAVVPFQTGNLMYLYIFVGLVLANLNWVIGSHWAVALSDFSKGSNRYFGAGSGGWTRLL